MPNLLDCPKTAVYLSFRAYFPSTLDIKQTVSTWLDTSILMSKQPVSHWKLVHNFVIPHLSCSRGESVNGNWSTPYFLLYYTEDDQFHTVSTLTPFSIWGISLWFFIASTLYQLILIYCFKTVQPLKHAAVFKES